MSIFGEYVKTWGDVNHVDHGNRFGGGGVPEGNSQPKDQTISLISMSPVSSVVLVRHGQTWETFIILIFEDVYKWREVNHVKHVSCFGDSHGRNFILQGGGPKVPKMSDMTNIPVLSMFQQI